MANAVSIVVTSTNETVQQLIDKTFSDAAGTTPSLNRLIDYLSGIASGAQTGATIQFTVRTSAPSITTSGSGSVQATISKL